MMQGRGVTNFSGDKPSHGYTTSTTEFDDELIKRGIVTTEQAMMAKGASLEEAFRLAEEKRSGRDSIVHKRNSNENNAESQQTDNGDTNSDVSDDDDDDFDFDDDDGFMERYRRERIEQLQKEHDTKRSSELMLRSNNPSSQILHIAREEWKEEVNEASMGNRWVIITMVEASGDRRDRVVQELHKVAREFFPERLPERNLDDGDGGFGNSPSARLLTIDASEAIPNWPEERVPAMFAYRNGVKQHEWIASRRGEFPSRDILEELFRQWNLI